MKPYQLFLLLIFYNCEGLLVKPTTIQIEDLQKELVLNAIHEVKSDTLLLSLSETIPFSDNSFRPTEIKINDATIILNVDNEIYEMERKMDSKYNYDIKLPNSLNFYENVSVNILHPNFENITAKTEIPNQIIPTQIKFIENPNETDQVTTLDYGVEISFKDDISKENYYSIGIKGPETEFIQIFEKIDGPGFDTIIIKSRPPITIESNFLSAINHPDLNTITFDDAEINGEQITLKLYFTSQREFDKDTYFLSFKTISKSLFKLEQSFPSYFDSQDFDFSGERAGIESNVSNKIGILGAFDEVLYPL